MTICIYRKAKKKVKFAQVYNIYCHNFVESQMFLFSSLYFWEHSLAIQQLL